MEALLIHADRTQPAIVDGAGLPWQGSPEAGVERRFLERIGGEVALASSIVRYRPGSRFTPHQHTLGEEFLVLEGTFSDEHGHYPAGSYVRNPPGSVHAPFSDNGCVIFVKLRQMPPDETRRICINPEQRDWRDADAPGVSSASLFRSDNTGIDVSLVRLAPGARVPAHDTPAGEELFVVEGQLSLGRESPATLGPWSWVRHPGRTIAEFASREGALLWVKRGHLTPLAS